jgi:hypothetical protein
MNGAAIASAAPLPAAAPGWVLVGTGDFNGDGREDLLWQNSAVPTQFWIYLMNGSAIIGSGGVTVAAGYSARFVTDFDGDGKADIMFEHPSGARWIFLMNGTAVSGRAAVPAAASGWALVGVGDFNGDGKADLLWQKRRDARSNSGFISSTAVRSSAAGGSPSRPATCPRAPATSTATARPTSCGRTAPVRAGCSS